MRHTALTHPNKLKEVRSQILSLWCKGFAIFRKQANQVIML
ncbi:hypothetical protein FDUTEX481_04700 [Tolypothrix sp. PCC 7601]|nr:hypothetical protein FDUTEX481_04700 [Tolypothrix sp. PCC 7601]